MFRLLTKNLTTRCTLSSWMPLRTTVTTAPKALTTMAWYYSTSTNRAVALPESVVVLEYKYGPNFWQRREPLHAGHLALAQEMIATGTCLAGGPKAPHCGHTYDGSSAEDEPTGAFFWFTTLEAAQEFHKRDPYQHADLVSSYSIYDWNVAVSRK